MDRKISITIKDAANKKFTFNGIRELHEFLKGEIKYWQQQFSNLEGKNEPPHQYLIIHQSFGKASQAIESWGDQINQWDDNQFKSRMESLQNQHLTNTQNYWLWSGQPYNSVFIECHRRFGDKAASGFIDLVINRQSSNITQGERFIGAIMGYEYLNPDSEMTKRKVGEENSFDHLRTQLSEKTIELITEVEKFKESLNSWNVETKRNWSQWEQKSAKEHDETQQSFQDEFERYKGDCKNKIVELESTYGEKLRLQKPAEYWSKAARKYKIQGLICALMIVIAIAAGLVLFADFFVLWLQGQEIGIELHTLKGILLFGSILAVYTYLIRILSKFTFSAFHLMRDAEEREQLTYLYLSLIKDQAIDTSSRDIILQALFSRSETGLLTSEHGPIMPAKEIAKIFTTERGQ